MKTIETKHGCYDAVRCGALDHHVCGSPDACHDVKVSGVVCTFGTTTRVTFHEQADIDAEVAATLTAIKDVDPAAFAAMTALDKAKVRVEVLKGKNIHSVKAEQAARDGGKKHGDDNRAFHDANRTVFGH